MSERELVLVVGLAGHDAAMNRALEALVGLPGTFGCAQFPFPAQRRRRLDPTYVPCNIESAFPYGGGLDSQSGTLVLDTEYGDCVLNLVRDHLYDWIYVQVPRGIAVDKADRWLFSTAEGLFARFPFRFGFLTGGFAWGAQIIDLAVDYDADGLRQRRPCDYLCPDEGGKLIRHRSSFDASP